MRLPGLEFILDGVRLGTVAAQVNLKASVLGPPLRRVVGCDRACFAEPLSRQQVRAHALRLEIGDRRPGALG